MRSNQSGYKITHMHTSTQTEYKYSSYHIATFEQAYTYTHFFTLAHTYHSSISHSIIQYQYSSQNIATFQLADTKTFFLYLRTHTHIHRLKPIYSSQHIATTAQVIPTLIDTFKSIHTNIEPHPHALLLQFEKNIHYKECLASTHNKTKECLTSERISQNYMNHLNSQQKCAQQVNTYFKITL